MDQGRSRNGAVERDDEAAEPRLPDTNVLSEAAWECGDADTCRWSVLPCEELSGWFRDEH